MHYIYCHKFILRKLFYQTVYVTLLSFGIHVLLSCNLISMYCVQLLISTCLLIEFNRRHRCRRRRCCCYFANFNAKVWKIHRFWVWKMFVWFFFIILIYFCCLIVCMFRSRLECFWYEKVLFYFFQCVLVVAVVTFNCI